ncbi:MAG: hypothetical protein KIS67_12940 [Verrucomicrobiae bacterium]|nr:hypothetical protein [Verrucomicrobiae bacterium]
MSRPKHSAGKLFSPANSPSRNFGIALFGDDVWTEQQEAIMKIVGHFENAMRRTGPARKRTLAWAVKQFDRQLRPLLLRALLRQDAQPFLDCARAIKAAHRVRKHGPVHKLEADILKGAPDLLDSQTVSAITEALPDFKDPSEVRRALKRLGISTKPDKHGPKSK